MWNSEYCYLSRLCDVLLSLPTTINAIPMPSLLETLIAQCSRMRAQLNVFIEDIDHMQWIDFTPEAEHGIDHIHYLVKKSN